MPWLHQFKIPHRGFTLLELMITISIIAVISAIGVTSFSQSQRLGRDSKRKSDLRSISIALELFYQKNGRYPCSGLSWVNSNAGSWLSDATNCTGGTGNSISPTYINSLPKDPLSNTGDPKVSGTYGYGYYSINNSLSASCPEGSYYILVTQLENVNDLERLGAKSLSLCGGSVASGASLGGTYLTNNFAVAAP